MIVISPILFFGKPEKQVRCRNARLSIGVFMLALLGGCATPQTREFMLAHSAHTRPVVELSNVPFYAQESHQCGPASLAMVLNAAGSSASPQDLTPQVYLPGREGSLQVEMLAATRRNGLIAYELPPRLQDLLAEVAAGSPVIVLQNLGLSWYPLWHYAVVVGYDLQREEVILRSGAERRQFLAMTTFEHTWARGGYWAMLALPPGKMPHKVDEAVYVSAAMALERAGQPKNAEAAYEAALKRWPRNLTARIGLGNAAYTQGNVVSAQQAYRQASLDHPASAIAFNNLAQTLADLGRYAEALAAANQAVSLGGAEEEAARITLDQVKNKIGL